MKKATNTFDIDEINGELLVQYEYELITDCNDTTGYNSVDESTIKVISVEIVICGVGIQILPKLTEKQIDNIIENLYAEI